MTSKRSLRIAQVVPVNVPVPPPGYGGIERVVGALTDELVEMGHDVTVFASGDSSVRARLEPLCEKSIWARNEQIDPLGCHLYSMEKIVRRAAEFDLWHFHFNYVHLPFLRRHPELKAITTLHVRLDLPDIRELLTEYQELPYVSISEAQRRPVPHARWVKTVHNGLSQDLYKPGAGGDYLVFLGRFSREKGLHRAVEIARLSGRKIKVAGTLDLLQGEYTQEVKALLKDPLVEFVGEVDDRRKQDLFGNAYATLFPIEWPEPFGLVMIESLACGTPVIATPMGAVQEVIDHRKTGFIVESVEEAVEALNQIPALSRDHCRREFERRFSSRAMAEGYLAAYQDYIQETSRVLLKGA